MLETPNRTGKEREQTLGFPDEGRDRGVLAQIMADSSYGFGVDSAAGRKSGRVFAVAVGEREREAGL